MRNVSQIVTYYAWDTSANTYKTGDAANHTLRGMQDGTEFTPAGSASEVDSTNFKGAYKVTIAATENIGTLMVLGGVSSTANIVLLPVRWSNDSPDVVRSGLAQAGASTSITLDSAASATDNIYNRCQVAIIAGTGVGQGGRIITGYVGATKVATVTPAWTTNPDSTSVFALLPAGADVETWLATAVTADASGLPAVDMTRVANTTQTARDLGANLDTTVSSRSTLTQAQILSDSTPFPGARIDAAISTRATQAQILSDATPFAGANVDAAISSRAPASTALSNATWTNVRAANLDNLDAAVSTRAPASTALSNATWTNTRAANLDNLDTTVSSRAPASTALSNATWTNAKAAQIDANISSRATPTQIVSDGVAFLGANVDAAVSSRAPAATALSNATWTNIRAANLDNLDATTSSRAPAATALSTANWTNARAVLVDNLGILKIKKNTALANFAFLMVLSSDHVSPATGLTVTVQRSIDGAAFANSSSTPATEIANGVYRINLSAADLNGDIIVLKCTATGADQRTIVIATEP